MNIVIPYQILYFCGGAFFGAMFIIGLALMSQSREAGEKEKTLK